MILQPLLKPLLTLILCISACTIHGQHSMQIEGLLDAELNTITIKQRIHYYNSSDDHLTVLYFND